MASGQGSTASRQLVGGDDLEKGTAADLSATVWLVSDTEKQSQQGVAGLLGLPLVGNKPSL